MTFALHKSVIVVDRSVIDRRSLGEPKGKKLLNDRGLDIRCRHHPNEINLHFY
jgi:hypothetical protein